MNDENPTTKLLAKAKRHLTNAQTRVDRDDAHHEMDLALDALDQVEKVAGADDEPTFDLGRIYEALGRIDTATSCIIADDGPVFADKNAEVIAKATVEVRALLAGAADSGEPARKDGEPPVWKDLADRIESIRQGLPKAMLALIEVMGLKDPGPEAFEQLASFIVMVNINLVETLELESAHDDVRWLTSRRFERAVRFEARKACVDFVDELRAAKRSEEHAQPSA